MPADADWSIFGQYGAMDVGVGAKLAGKLRPPALPVFTAPLQRQSLMSSNTCVELPTPVPPAVNQGGTVEPVGEAPPAVETTCPVAAS